MIKREEVEKLATLSRMELSSEEIDGFTKEISSILDYVDGIKEADTGDNKSEATDRVRLRDDGEPHESGKYTEAILSQAPEREGQYLSVKKIL